MPRSLKNTVKNLSKEELNKRARKWDIVNYKSLSKTELIDTIFKYQLANNLKRRLKPLTKKIEVAGSIRRKKNVIRDLDIVLVPTNRKQIKHEIMQMGMPIKSGENIISRTIDGIQVDFYIATPKEWGAMLLFLTGSRQFNIASRSIAKKKYNLSLTQTGLYTADKKILISSKSEKEIFNFLRREYIPPKMRSINFNKAWQQYRMTDEEFAPFKKRRNDIETRERKKLSVQTKIGLIKDIKINILEKIPPIIPTLKSEKPSKKIVPMLAIDDGMYFNHPNYILQQKYDGTRCIIIKENNRIYMMGRNWKNNFVPLFPKIAKDIAKIPLKNFVLDSELTFFDKNNRDIFLTALATKRSKKDFIAKCVIFDILEYDNRDIRALPLLKRLYVLERIVPKRLRYIKVIKSYKGKHKERFKTIISDQMQGEGVMLKNMNSMYFEGGRSNAWVKAKAWKSDEAVVVGLTKGKGRRSDTFGALIIAQLNRAKDWQYVGKVAGFTDDELGNLFDKFQKLKIITPQISSEQLKKLGVRLDVLFWVKPKEIIEAKFQEKTNKGIFRFPNVLRDGKGNIKWRTKEKRLSEISVSKKGKLLYI